MKAKAPFYEATNRFRKGSIKKNSKANKIKRRSKPQLGAIKRKRIVNRASHKP